MGPPHPPVGRTLSKCSFLSKAFFSVYLGLRLCKDEARCELRHRSRTRKKGQASESARHWVENFRLRPDCGCSISAGASGEEQESKTANATRIIDIPEVFASELTGDVSEVRGYIFATAGAGLCNSEMFFGYCIRCVRPASMFFGDSG